MYHSPYISLRFVPFVRLSTLFSFEFGSCLWCPLCYLVCTLAFLLPYRFAVTHLMYHVTRSGSCNIAKFFWVTLPIGKCIMCSLLLLLALLCCGSCDSCTYNYWISIILNPQICAYIGYILMQVGRSHVSSMSGCEHRWNTFFFSKFD